MAEYTTISVSPLTKEEFDKQRVTPMGEVGSDDFLNYLLKENKKRK